MWEGKAKKNCYKWQLATRFDGGKEHREVGRGGEQKKKKYAHIDITKSEPDHAPTHTDTHTARAEFDYQ